MGNAEGVSPSRGSPGWLWASQYRQVGSVQKRRWSSWVQAARTCECTHKEQSTGKMRIKHNQPRCELPRELLHESIHYVNTVFVRFWVDSLKPFKGKYFAEKSCPSSPRCSVPLLKTSPPGTLGRGQGCSDIAPAFSAVAAFPRSTSQLSTLELIREPYAPFSHIIKACV